MDVRHEAAPRGVRASYLLPINEEAASVDGWLELERGRLRFRDERGLDLRIRVDRLDGISFAERCAGERPPPDAGRPDGAGSPGLMRLVTGGSSPVSWELLVARHDALAVREAITIALDERGLPSPDPTLREELEAVLPDPVEATEVTPDGDPFMGLDPAQDELDDLELVSTPDDDEGDPEAWLDPEPDPCQERARLVRRRRVIALAVLGTTLMLAAEALIPLLVLR